MVRRSTRKNGRNQSGGSIFSFFTRKIVDTKKEKKSKKRKDKDKTKEPETDKKGEVVDDLSEYMTPVGVVIEKEDEYHTPLSADPTVKLDLSTPAFPYEPTDQPVFWEKIFGYDLLKIRDKLTGMLNDSVELQGSAKDMKLSGTYPICNKVRSHIKSFHVPAQLDSTTELVKEQTYYFTPPEQKAVATDFSHQNRVLCATLLLVGIISNAMKHDDYEIIIKGGKAVQLVVNTDYQSKDIDILIKPKGKIEYDKEKVKNLSKHLGFLLDWFFSKTTMQGRITIQLPPDQTIVLPDGSIVNENLVKLKYKTEPIYGKRSLEKAFMDIGFENIDAETADFYADTTLHKFTDPDFGELHYRCPTIFKMLKEKIHYYVFYKKELARLEKSTVSLVQQNRKKRENDIVYANLMIDKFRRAIFALTAGDPAKQNVKISLRLDRIKPKLSDEERKQMLEEITRKTI